MTAPQMSDDFAGAFRTALIDHIDTPARLRSTRRRWWLGGGVTALALFAGTATAAATGLLPVPGATDITTISTTTTGTFTGTNSIDLGATPDDANGVVLSLRCLTPGRFGFPDGSSLRCSSTDFGTGTEPGIAPSLFPLSNVIDGSMQITTSPDARWSMTATYATATTTDWATNEEGLTYGVINENGEPDLIAVTADDGEQGYVRRSDLEDADGTTAQRSFTTPEDALEWQEQNEGIAHTIPVYVTDGTTRVGDFTVG
ncbi:peptidase M56 family protein [Rathayibacter sp. AY1G1]|uniref:peptidase M56 family protein n=1 Tax=Rathayibacter sp. AY1G1 TaxID=2080564 RepID=UPI000CE7F9FB|nr:peptidase M56 family protein [Rathayibacter sp. AY1G1]PPH08583.1 peptidase M56 family protein [Rathayibacter sp. AY1G1]